MAASRPITAFPRPEDILSRLEKESLVPLYLFHGDESYLIDQAVAQVRRRLGNRQEGRAFYAGEDSLDALLEAWGAPSLFARQSLVLLRNAERLKAAERERLAKEAELRDTTQPLVVCAHGRVDQTQKFFALCAKKGFVAEFRPPFANQMSGWVQRFARERGVHLSEEAVHLLSDLTGPNLLALAAEIEKLMAFVFPGTEITAETVTACAGDLQKHSAFDLADALGQRDRQKALGLLRRVLVDEREALPVLHALMSHFRRLWQVKELLDSRTPEEQIERAIGLRGLRLRALLGQSRLYTAADLRRLLHRAAALDLTLKSTRISPSALF
ncbi:MAG: DNA polymerase III subunit delta, partial [Candidatus Binatia bacterium]